MQIAKFWFCHISDPEHLIRGPVAELQNKIKFVFTILTVLFDPTSFLFSYYFWQCTVLSTGIIFIEHLIVIQNEKCLWTFL